MSTPYTLVAVVHGGLHDYPTRSSPPTSDVFSLFVARATAMGWLSDVAKASMSRTWGMNDAVRASPVADRTVAGDRPESEPAEIARFQVVLTEPLSSSRPVPTQEFLSCIEATLSRIGDWQFVGLDMIVPIHALSDSRQERTGAMFSLVQSAQWFEDLPEAAGVDVEVILDSGQSPAALAIAPLIAQDVNAVKQNVFQVVGCGGRPLIESSRAPTAPVTDQLWNGPPRHAVAIDGRIVEWSWASVGWTVALLAELLSRHGLTTPVLMSLRT